MYEKIRLTVADGIALITLNNPEEMNTLYPQTFEELSRAMDEIERDTGMRAVVIFGTEKLFSAGDNVKAPVMPLPPYERARFMQRSFSRIEKMSVPVIAAVAGYALGGGFELALACDFIIASENAKFGLPEAKLGVLPCIGGTQRLPRLIGAARAKELMFTCEFLSARQAYEYGIANRVVPEGTVLDSAMATARKIAQIAPLAVALINQAVDAGLNADLETGLQIEARNSAALFYSEDRAEGMAAFREKRKPVFKNR